jgi:hypothetical protein
MLLQNFRKPSPQLCIFFTTVWEVVDDHLHSVGLEKDSRFKRNYRQARIRRS